MSQTLALFDLDNTLIAGDSDHAWGEFLSNEGLVDADAHRKKNDQFYADYCSGELDIRAYQRFALSTIAGKSIEELAPLRTRFLQEMITPMLLDTAQTLVQRHREAGDLLMIITATNDFVTRPIADIFGIEHLIACEAEVIDGQYTGDIVGTPSYQEGKVKRLRAWLAGQDHTLEGSYFYSDSHNDLALLQLVTNPVAVDPDEKLREIALEREWQVISLRGEPA